MKSERKKRFVGLDAKSAFDLAEMLNQFYDEHNGEMTEVVYCGEFGLSALLSWEEVTHTAETLREEYEMRGEGRTCRDCDHRQPQTDGRKRCGWYCLRRPRGTDLDAPACNHFYLAMEGEHGEG